MKLSFDDHIAARFRVRPGAEKLRAMRETRDAGQAALAQQAQPEMPTREMAEALPSIVPLYTHEDYVKRSDVLALFAPKQPEDGHHKSVAALPPDAVPTLCPGEDQRDNSGPVAAPKS